MSWLSTCYNISSQQHHSGTSSPQDGQFMRNEPSGDNDETVAAHWVADLDVHPPSPGREAALATRANRFSPGDVLSDRFVIIRFLGAGGMGEVYEARDRALQGTSVALKTISPELAASVDAKERFQREVLLAREINHPNVCPIYDICHHQDSQGACCFLYMKFLPGETLANRLTTSGLSDGEAIPIVRQLAAALQAAHREGIIHRDVKPSNIMLDGSGVAVKAVVTDFGLARRNDNDLTTTSSTGPMGTPGYIAPEILQGYPATAASDLYSFGLVVLEIFTGKRPMDFNRQHPLDFVPALRSPTVPSFVDKLVSGCLADDPKLRYQAFQESLADLDLDPRVSSPAYGFKPYWTRRHLLGAAITAGCAMAGTAFLERESITELFRPLPRRRFVALVNWPNSEGNLTAMLSGVLDALERELSRAEAFDRDLYVMYGSSTVKDSHQLNQLRDSMGANLVLASSAVSESKDIQLSLKILDPSVSRVLRKRIVTCGMNELAMLPGMAVRTAAELLGVSRFIQDNSRLMPSTQSADAYRAFQAGEALWRKQNGEGVEAAIEQYKLAVERDTRYAIAYTKLALAYVYQYGMRGDLAYLDLARANATTALSLDPNQTGGHLAISCYWRYHGQTSNAITEMNKALSLDPGDPATLIWETKMFLGMNRFAEAENVFQKLLTLRPNYWAAYNQLGELFSRQGKYPQALEAYRSASIARPNNALALANVGLTQMILGRLKEARQSLEKSMAQYPSGFAAGNLAEELRLEGDFTGAVKYALQAVELEGSDVQNWLELGDCYSSLKGHLQDAKSAYLRGLDGARQRVKTDGSDGPGLMLLALFQAKTSDISEALVNIKKAEGLGALELDSQLYKARIQELAGQRAQALATLRTCFHGGATKVQIDLMPDLESLRAAPLYHQILKG